MLLFEFYNAFPNSTEMFSAKNVKLLASKIYSFLTSLRAITGNVGLGQTITRQQKISKFWLDMLQRYCNTLYGSQLSYVAILHCYHIYAVNLLKRVLVFWMRSIIYLKGFRFISWYPNLSEVIIYSRMYLKLLLSLQKRSLLEIGNARRMQTLKTQFCKRTNSPELLLLKYTHSLIMKRN